MYTYCGQLRLHLFVTYICSCHKVMTPFYTMDSRYKSSISIYYQSDKNPLRHRLRL